MFELCKGCCLTFVMTTHRPINVTERNVFRPRLMNKPDSLFKTGGGQTEQTQKRNTFLIILYLS